MKRSLFCVLADVVRPGRWLSNEYRLLRRQANVVSNDDERAGSDGNRRYHFYRVSQQDWRCVDKRQSLTGKGPTPEIAAADCLRELESLGRIYAIDVMIFVTLCILGLSVVWLGHHPAA